MVGVPGRSKGCITCRKRKKGCDLATPECGQCKERGTPCGGYDADRVFVYQDHMSKRNSKRSPQGTTSTQTTTDTSTSSIVPAGSHVPNRTAIISPPTSVILPASLTRSAFGEKGLEAFFKMYLPEGDMRGTDKEGKTFLGMVPTLTVRDEALQLALLAVGTVAQGKHRNDTVMVQQGRKLYSRALIETRRALQDGRRARSAAIFAIPRVLAIYEILYADPNNSNQAVSWLSHAEGEVALILARGPEAFVEDESHDLFVNARYRPLIAAVRTRTPSPLNKVEWKTIPWRGKSKTSNDTLLDILAGIPEILERVDKFGMISSGSPDDQAQDLETIAMCWNLHFPLEEWVLANQDNIYSPLADTATPIDDFPNLEIASLTIKYWVTALLLYSSLDTAMGIPPSDDSLSYPDRPHPRLFARRIARSAPYFFLEEFGITGATALSFPLGNTMLYFRRNPPVDLEYMILVKRAWGNPQLPSAIKAFLDSMRASVTIRDKTHSGRTEI